MNLLPPNPKGVTLNYYCTWSAQNVIGQQKSFQAQPQNFLGDQGAMLARDAMTEANIFGPNGLAYQYPEIRKDLLFVLDDGWDVPMGANPGKEMWRFGSLIPDAERFPSCQGTPVERLTKLAQMIHRAGWKGLGIWVAAQAMGEDSQHGAMTSDASDAYWIERLRWSNQAEIAYWKVDWGTHADDIPWRQRLCALRDKEAPNLIIEHCLCLPPVNNAWIENGIQKGNGRFAGWRDYPQRAAAIASFSDAFRTYDILNPLYAPSTLDRAAELFRMLPGSSCILNCEDAPYIGASLGLAIGIMRSSLSKNARLQEITRAIRWQNLAPAFPLKEGQAYASSELAEDCCSFLEGDTWYANILGHTITQACPQILTRNIGPLHMRCTEEHAPILLASKHPNGAVAAFSVPRRMGREQVILSQASVSLPIEAPDKPVGLFGYWESITLIYPEPITGKKVLAQDLASDRAVDITDGCTIHENAVCLPGELLAAVGTQENKAEDASAPGLMVSLHSAK